MPTTATISRRINAERVVLVGWVRALLLQVAHPLIAAGVAEHSTFRGSTAASFSRLKQTIDAMLAITFGTPQQRGAALERIRAIHRRVHGTLPAPVGLYPAGTRYSAEDPDLLLWVHVTLVESVILAYEQLVGPLSPTDRDRYCADSADVAVELGVPIECVPRAWEGVRSHVAEGLSSGAIVVGAQARQIAATVLSPWRSPCVRKLVTPAVSLLAAGQLPAAVRTQYGLTWNRRRAGAYARAVKLFRLVRCIAPARLRVWKIARCNVCWVVCA